MADLLLELFSEEIPARMQKDALETLLSSIQTKIAAEGIKAEGAKGYVTPRRLAVWLRGLPVATAATETELKGPKLGAPEAAMQGFLKKTGLSQSDLTERDGVYFAIVRKDGQQTADVLKTIIQDVLSSFPWPKSMRWGSGSTTWVRPLHSMLCVFDGKIIDVAFAGIHAGHMTHGHRFLNPHSIMISKADEYELMLERAYVTPDRDKRKAEILKQAQAAADAAGLTLKNDEGLLEEVTGLVEWPTVLVGTIDKQYMDLPKEVLVSEMRAHQKYFALENKDGTLSDKFLITSNMTANDEGKAIIAGNERVLRARLADGRFFWDQDRKKPLSEWSEGLKTVTYHAKLGTIADKVERVTKLALELADVLKADKKLVERAAKLCKADLTTGMVGEFPELQGVMGRYYATAQKEDTSVADAIRDHYLPLGPTTPVPSDKVAVCVALADKLDTLIAMFAIGEKPTGSKDPFALRRAALGVIRIILENKLRLPLKSFFDDAPAQTIATLKTHEKLTKQTEAKLADAHRIGKYLSVNETASTELSEAVPANLADMLYDFFADRLKVQLKDQGMRHDVVAAVMADGDDDLLRVVERAKAVQDFISTEDGINLLAGYKRAANILAIEEKKDSSLYPSFGLSELASAKLEAPEEINLRDTITTMHEEILIPIRKEDYNSAMQLLAKLRQPVDHFFDKVMVNVADAELRVNRLRLLASIRNSVDNIANFSLIEGEQKEQKKKAA